MVAVAQDVAHIAHQARQAHTCATTGDFGATVEALATVLEDDRPITQAWRLALMAQRWHADPDLGAMPSLEECKAFSGTDEPCRVAASLACIEAAKREVIAHDEGSLQKWVALFGELSGGCADSSLSVWSRVLEGWLALAEGGGSHAQKAGEAAAAMASEHKLAPAVIEAAVVKAYAAEALGEVQEATALARRASRMARTEDLPQWQYLSSLALARMRRLSGTPHLTARILRPMLAVAPAVWRGAIAWECLMAGAQDFACSIELDDTIDPSGEVRTLQRLLSAAVDGGSSAFGEMARQLESAMPRWSSRTRDARAALGVLDATRSLDDLPEEVQAWCAGRESSTPGSIKGLCVDLNTEPGDPGPAAFVVAGPRTAGHETSRRIAGLAESLFAQAAKVERKKGKSERIPATLAALALAGPGGLPRGELFRSVYGFDYEPELHRAMFNILIHRVRQVLGDRGSLETSEDRYSLELAQTLVIPDPRCEQSLEEMVLRALALVGAQGAKGAAQALGAPLRTVQTAMKHLVEEGAVVVERDGKFVRYVVEDTTFSEPTKWS